MLVVADKEGQIVIQFHTYEVELLYDALDANNDRLEDWKEGTSDPAQLSKMTEDIDRTSKLNGEFSDIIKKIRRRRAMRKKTAIDERETATILAALRLWQLEPIARSSAGELDGIASNGGTLDPLDPEEIDYLCEFLNLGRDHHPTPAIATVNQMFAFYFPARANQIRGGEMELNSPCGSECEKAILAGVALAAHARAAYGITDPVIADVVARVCGVYING